MKIKFAVDRKEKWKKCRRNKKYSVSNFGRIRNDKTGRVLKPYIQKQGYCCVNLYKNGEKELIYIHRIVAETFIGPKPLGKEVNHVNPNRNYERFNHVDNLEYVTRSENLKHAYKHNLMVRPIGEKNGRALTNKKEVKKIRKEWDKLSLKKYSKKDKLNILLRKYKKLSKSCIEHIVYKINWKSI